MNNIFCYLHNWHRQSTACSYQHSNSAQCKCPMYPSSFACSTMPSNTTCMDGLTATSLKHALHKRATDNGSSVVLGFAFLTVTLHMIWNGVKDGHRGLSVKVTTITPPTAYTSQKIPTLLAFSCSGDWNPRLPASIVLVPICAVSVRTFDIPKSVKVTCKVMSSICTIT